MKYIYDETTVKEIYDQTVVLGRMRLSYKERSRIATTIRVLLERLEELRKEER